MALTGNKVAQFKIKSNGDLFYELWKKNPHQIPSITPTTYQNCQTVEGEVGTVGCVLLWNYCHDGNNLVVKTLNQEVDEGKKSVSMKAVEGDVLKLFKNIVVHVDVDTNGSDNIVTWTIEYEKLSPNIPDPDPLFDFFNKATKDIEAHHLTVK